MVSRMRQIDATALDGFRREFTGDVTVPDDPGYETRSFRDLTGVQAFLLAKLQQLEGEADLMHPEE